MAEPSHLIHNPTLSPIDTPLKDPSQDLLGRSHFARGLAQGILEMDAEHGFVVALHGPWGSGKSTTLNFVLHYINELSDDDDRPIVVQFNPWWFAGQEQLLIQFFGQMQAAFSRKDAPEQLRRIGSAIESFSLALAPLAYIPVTSSLAGPLKKIVGSLGEHIRKTGERNRTDVMQLRRTIDRLLAGQPRKVLVVIDDIDRLSAEEVRLMFQLIKAVADFPKTIYLLAFSRDVVIDALDQAQPDQGEAYLEKIVQVPFNLPLPGRQDLHDLFSTRLESILRGTPDEFRGHTYWGNVFLDGIAPLLKNLRDVKRLLNALQITYPLVRGEVNAVDFVAVESLRVFVPAMWSIVRSNPGVFAGSTDLTAQYDPGAGANLDAKRELLERHLVGGTTNETRRATHSLLQRLFPLYASAFGGPHYDHSQWAQTWRTERKVRSPEVFPLFFQLAVEEGAMTLAEFRSIMTMADDEQAFAGELERLAEELMPEGQTSRIYEFMSHLRDLAPESELLPRERVPAVVQAAYDAGDSILKAKLPRGTFGLPQAWHLDFMFRDLLLRLPEQEARYQVLYNAFTQSKAVSMIASGISFLGREHGKFGAGSRTPAEQMVSRDQLADLERIALERIKQAEGDGELSSAPNLRRILYVWEQLAGADQAPRSFVSLLVRCDRGMTRFLSSFLEQIVSSGMSDRVAQSEWIINMPAVKPWVEPGELRDRAQALLNQQTHWLKDKEKLALEVFLRDLEQAPGGYDDSNRPQQVDDTEPELKHSDPSDH